jgi:succinate-acetate transporter protein
MTIAVNLSNENSGPIVFLGGLLLLITSILEFILGNTFPCVVFGTIGEFKDIEKCTAASRSRFSYFLIGGFWFAFAATMIPAFNAAGTFFFNPDYYM